MFAWGVCALLCVPVGVCVRVCVRARACVRARVRTYARLYLRPLAPLAHISPPPRRRCPQVVLNTVAAMFSEYCSTPYEIEPVEVIDSFGESHGEGAILFWAAWGV